MKFLSVHLTNYIGIYNGMGLYDINIDFTKCKNRMTIIRGTNGSGKSTLSKAMNLFPDGSDNFIPGMEARKELILADGPTLYAIRFIHGIKANGDREVTKAYITKTFNGCVAELNENGNVTSYKDILYEELGLDANFVALSQLSTDDRGLADKKPAERKRFVNSIISSMDAYNNIYKTLSKRSTNYRSMINSVSAKLSVLGDEAVVAANLEAIEVKINTLRDQKDAAFAALATAQSTIQLLDPDGSIQSTNTVVSAELDLAEKELKKIQNLLDSLLSKAPTQDIDASLARTTAKKNEAKIDCQILRNKIDNLLNQKEQESLELEKKIQRLQQLSSGESYETLKARYNECSALLASIQAKLIEVGISDPESISKDEYILALETLKDLNEYISIFKGAISYSIIDELVGYYLRTDGQMLKPRPIDIYDSKIKSFREEIDIKKSAKRDIDSRIGLLDKLSMRPSGCTISDCPFIKDALDFSNTAPLQQSAALAEEINTLEEIIAELEGLKSIDIAFNEGLAKFSVIVREVTKNAAILSKLRNGEMFANPRVFFERLLNGYAFDYMQDIYRYIDLANLFDVYKVQLELLKRYDSEIKVYESKSTILDELQADIDRINTGLTEIMLQIEPVQAQIEDLERDISILIELEATYSSALENVEKQKPFIEKIKECRRVLTENSRKINQIAIASAQSEEHRSKINELTFALEPLMKDRDKLLHSRQLIADYKQELAELQANFDYIETIKFYSSPTTGIQLVFMQLYMGKIIALANDLLKFLFDGQFEIQPFVINESEFRIPCLGNGYLNDDISSMSSSQIGMISMILSFALLHHSSTKYNIIKLDEIDGPLDYNNRLYFMDVLNRIMNIMQTEQCIMISHNTELQVDNSDVILLRHDESNMDYQRGNIIWSF